MGTERERVSVRFPKAFVDGIDELVSKGLYMERQDLIRDAVFRLLLFWRVRVFNPEAEPGPAEEAGG